MDSSVVGAGMIDRDRYIFSPTLDLVLYVVFFFRLDCCGKVSLFPPVGIFIHYVDGTRRP